MPVDAVPGVSDAAASAQSATTTVGQSSASSKDTFLQLLVTELRNQDPMNPVDNKEMVVQLAQLSTLEQMENMNSMIRTQTEVQSVGTALSLVGQEVEYLTGEGEETTSGMVEAVEIERGLPTLIVDGQRVLPGNVVSVRSTGSVSALSSQLETTMEMQTVSDALALVGRQVEYVDADGETILLGVVEGVDVADGMPMLMIGSSRVFPSEVLSVLADSAVETEAE